LRLNLHGSAPAEVEDNVRLFAFDIPPALWRTLRDSGCIDSRAPTPD
jgi:hypothetical protein